MVGRLSSPEVPLDPFPLPKVLNLFGPCDWPHFHSERQSSLLLPGGSLVQIRIEGGALDATIPAAHTAILLTEFTRLPPLM